jgi:hypothetical protein
MKLSKVKVTFENNTLIICILDNWTQKPNKLNYSETKKEDRYKQSSKQKYRALFHIYKLYRELFVVLFEKHQFWLFKHETRAVRVKVKVQNKTFVSNVIAFCLGSSQIWNRII